MQWRQLWSPSTCTHRYVVQQDAFGMWCNIRSSMSRRSNRLVSLSLDSECRLQIHRIQRYLPTRKLLQSSSASYRHAWSHHSAAFSYIAHSPVNSSLKVTIRSVRHAAAWISLVGSFLLLVVFLISLVHHHLSWLWNDLPPGLRRPGLSFDSFRRSLKTHLFGNWSA